MKTSFRRYKRPTPRAIAIQMLRDLKDPTGSNESRSKNLELANTALNRINTLHRFLLIESFVRDKSPREIEGTGAGMLKQRFINGILAEFISYLREAGAFRAARTKRIKPIQVRCAECAGKLSVRVESEAIWDCPYCGCQMRVNADPSFGEPGVTIVEPAFAFRPRPPMTLVEGYRFLKVTPADSFPIIASAYKEAALRYHPDNAAPGPSHNYNRRLLVENARRLKEALEVIKASVAESLMIDHTVINAPMR